MEGGQVTHSGSYENLLMAGTAFENLVNAHKEATTVLGSSNNERETEHQNGNIDQMEESSGSYFAKENTDGEISVKGLTGAQLTEKEEKEVGDVGWTPFLDYISISKGSLHLSSSIIAQCGFVALQVASTYWLAITIQMPSISSSSIIGVYTGISTLSTFFVYLRSLFAALLGLKASKAFFSGFINSIFKAPMLFFDSTPVGRILTRVRYLLLEDAHS